MSMQGATLWIEQPDGTYKLIGAPENVGPVELVQFAVTTQLGEDALAMVARLMEPELVIEPARDNRPTQPWKRHRHNRKVHKRKDKRR